MKKKILYVTRLDPYSLKSWSGVTYYILKYISKYYEVITVGPLSNRVRIFYIVKRFVFSLLKIKFDIDRPISVLKDFAKQIEYKTKNIDYDAILTSEASLMTFLNTNKPIFIYTDFVFSTYYSHYFSEKIIHKETIKDGNFCEGTSLKKAKKIILTSTFAVNDAVKKYRIKKSSFHYLPFGASIDFIPKQKLLKKIILKKNLNICKLISIGVHWDRKGMDKAVKLVDYMNNSGQETILYIVGAKPPEDYKISTNVKLIDFLDKNNLNDRKILIKLMYNAHFNLLFSKSEAFGVVNVEASAFGLYTITNNIGGIGGAVTNNINGFMFKDNENISAISKYIIRIFRNKDLFIKKSFLSRKQYQEKLNWRIISKNLSTIINNNLLKN
jgi:glycosyltransferase involved in cell wall biosynthesis